MRKITSIKPEEDAVGQEILAYYQGREALEIWERDDGYIIASSTEPKIYFSEYEDWSLHQKKAMEFVKGRVLDIGCGAGRHSLYLQKKGFDVLGIDCSPLAIKVCKLRGVKRAKVMSIEEVILTSSSFDTILMLGNNFSVFNNFEKAKKLLKKLQLITSRNALIIAETRDPYKTNDPVYLEYYKLNKRKGRMSGQLKCRVRFRKFATRWFDWLMVSKEEMKEILNGTGWKIREFIDSEDAQYVAIIEKIA
ncbi:MAG: class I SAM-dependent methyltransferase [Promethearchaeota archaeon]